MSRYPSVWEHTSNILITLTYSNNDSLSKMSLSQICMVSYIILYKNPFCICPPHHPLPEPKPYYSHRNASTLSRFPAQSFPTVPLREENHFFATASCGRRSVGAGVGALFLYSLLERKYSLTGRDLHSSCLGLFAYLGATPCVRHFSIPSSFSV
ncbi:unnamed protein product [Tuber melanosporum]|uniref:(Perigord truffle) hypothetical protein n=1 Tax=Tuber melanosporum (strain Mel28) TaxID=656061 RepID=D5G8D2_TUBMM|nr:uncharacterized protein GSTUM_00004756001 [Tuber melanosporum]CAZ80775.1 unnamed protein product [Tuber melanosporum]